MALSQVEAGMPNYEYSPIEEGRGCEHCREGFEEVQSMSDPPLEKCPRCGARCQRVFSTFSVGGSGKSLLSPSNLGRHGFTQYKRRGKGYYEKTAGQGPKAIADGD
jgi:putative FmdB family regulatory protein